MKTNAELAIRVRGIQTEIGLLTRAIWERYDGGGYSLSGLHYLDAARKALEELEASLKEEVS